MYYENKYRVDLLRCIIQPYGSENTNILLSDRYDEIAVRERIINHFRQYMIKFQ